MKKALFVFVFSLIPVLILVSCSKDNDDGGGTQNPGTTACTNVPKSWSADVNPIIQSTCNQAGCHNAGSINGPGPLTNHAQVAAARSLVRDAVESGRMPQNSTLTTAQKNSIICWIDSGAPNN